MKGRGTRPIISTHLAAHLPQPVAEVSNAQREIPALDELARQTAAVPPLGEGLKRTDAKPLANLIDHFVTSMGSLEKTLLLVMAEVSRHHSRAHRKFDEFVAKGTCEEFEASGRTAFRPKSHDYCQEFSDLTAGLDMTHIATRTVPRSFLVALVSEYDFFIRSFFSSVLLAKPNLMMGSHRTLEISRLLAFEAIPDAYQWVVEEEIDELMRGSHLEQFDYLDTKFNIRWKREQDPLWRKFIEVTERRNLFVHTDGFVSNQYLEVCRNNKAIISSPSKGDELTVTPDYFTDAYETLLEMGIKVSQVLWRKQFPEQAKESDRSIWNTSYDLLMNKRYLLAKNLLSFATTTLKNKLQNEEQLLYFKVSLAIALKNLDDRVEFAKCMASEEWHKKRDLFRLAEAVLNERYHDAVILMRKVGDGVHKADYRRWPLYERFRNFPEFKLVFREIFGEDVGAHDHRDRALTVSGRDFVVVPGDSPARNQLPPLQRRSSAEHEKSGS